MRQPRRELLTRLLKLQEEVGFKLISDEREVGTTKSRMIEATRTGSITIRGHKYRIRAGISNWDYRFLGDLLAVEPRLASFFAAPTKRAGNPTHQLATTRSTSS